MSNNDDEFKDVQMGLPSDNTVQKSSIKFILIFVAGGLIIALLVFLLGDYFRGKFAGDDYIPQQISMNGLISLVIGSLQAWIFKARIKSRVGVFIGFSLLGGVIGGVLSGSLINSGIRTALIIGATNGMLAGGISSFAQNKLMGNKKYETLWFLYNLIAWTIIYSIAWMAAWSPDTNNFILALAGGFVIIASGISLVLFLRQTPQIEFS